MRFSFSGHRAAFPLLAVLCLCHGPAHDLQGAPASAAIPVPAARGPKVASRISQLALGALSGGVAQSPLQSVEPTMLVVESNARNKKKLLMASIGSTPAAVKPAVSASGVVKSAVPPPVVPPALPPAVIPISLPATAIAPSVVLSTPVPSLNRQSVDVLMIGDSMSVGEFGDSVTQYLKTQRYSVAMYASCGSSPEHWIKGEAEFVTRCGYKALTPKKNYYTDFEGRKPPTPTATPKVEDLIECHQPAIVLIQLGTNWMDAVQARYNSSDHARYVNILAKFARAVHSSKSVQKVIWITPPDSARYSADTERKVNALIRDSAGANDIMLVDSASMTHYIAGKTGGDGVHFKKSEALAWAVSVEKDLTGKMR